MRLIAVKVVDIFQLTTSHRGRRDDFVYCDTDSVFQLTTSHRGRQFFRHVIEIKKDVYFNSLPHTEVDAGSRQGFIRVRISTHYLTQR